MTGAAENHEDDFNPDKEDKPQSGKQIPPDPDEANERILRRGRLLSRMAFRLLRATGKKLSEHEMKEQLEGLPDDLVEDKQSYLEWFTEIIEGL